MLNKNLVALLASDVTTIGAKFEIDGDGAEYTFKVPRGMVERDNVQVGDFGLCTKARNAKGFHAVVVTRIDTDAYFENPEEIEYSWVLGFVPAQNLAAIEEGESQRLVALEEALRAARRREQIAETGLTPEVYRASKLENDLFSAEANDGEEKGGDAQ